MKLSKLVLLLMSSLYCTAAFAQAPAVDIPITVSDEGGVSKQLNLGIDPLATDGLDPSFGELTLPPTPFPGAFDVRFQLPCDPVEYSLKDYRQGTAGAAIQREHILLFQPGEGSQMTISWNMPAGVTGLLQDVVTGDLIYISMSGSGSFVANSGTYDKLKITVSYSSPVAKIKLFLEGPYSPGSMSKLLLSKNLIPLDQPYNKAPWNFSGTEKLASVPSDVVDWVVVELRTDTSASSKVAARAALLKTDGTVTDLDGTSPLKFNGLLNGNYYIVIRHRNHLSVMSSLKAAVNLNPDTYDFTTGKDKYLGGDAKDLGDGKYALYAGDANADGQITSLDFNEFNPKFNNAVNGYEMSDWNMDGQITSLDFNLFNPNFNNAKSSKVP